MNLRGRVINKKLRIIGTLAILLVAAAGIKLYSESIVRKKNNSISHSSDALSVSPSGTVSGMDAAETGILPYSENSSARASATAARMSHSQLAGQVMMIGYMGATPSDEILTWIREKNIGGIKIFGWNADNLSVLSRSIGEMQKAASETQHAIPLFMATDQEGGWVRHIKGTSSVTPGNMALGASAIVNDAYMTGMYIGQELKALGINMNFAPTVDVLINHEAQVIGPRAFSDDPLQTAILATSYMNGMKNSGIISTAKHFPGHGRTEVDSHGRLPVIDTSLDDLMKSDLLPYDFLIREKLPAIMSGHLAFPGITGSATPASLSPFFLKELLREKMNFNGVIITDDMQMNGALYKSSVPESCLAAIKAGNDMVMISRDINDYERLRQLIMNELRANSDFEKQVRESVKRILAVKFSYINTEKNAPGKQFNPASVPTQEASDFFRQQAFRSATLLYPDKGIKTPEKNSRILLAGPLKLFFDEGLRRFPGAETYSYPYTPFYSAAENDLLSLPQTAASFDTVIFCAANPAGMELLKTLESKNCRVIIISVLSPAYFAGINWPESGVAVYGTGRDSFAAGFAAIAGDFTPEGSLPIMLSGGKK